MLLELLPTAKRHQEQLTLQVNVQQSPTCSAELPLDLRRKVNHAEPASLGFESDVKAAFFHSSLYAAENAWQSQSHQTA